MTVWVPNWNDLQRKMETNYFPHMAGKSESTSTSRMAFLDELRNILDSERVLTGEPLSQSYFHIWQMEVPLIGKALVYPRTTTEVSEIMKLCHRNKQPVVVFGGRTNLVGSTKPQGNEVLMSFEKMNTIVELDAASRCMTVEAGVLLENIHRTAQSEDLMFPLNFGARGSAQIGGIISTNAGGLRVLRYGMTRNLLLGLEVVLADGSIISSLKKIIKDNSAYDLKQLFAGSEGTLGIVTKAVLRLYEAPSSRASCMVALDSYEKVIALLKHMDKGLAGTLSGFELMWPSFYEAGTTAPAETKPPLPHGHSYYVLVESLGSDKARDLELMTSLLESALEQELIVDGTIASTESELNWFWKIREDVHACVSRSIFNQHFDISLPIVHIGSELSKMRTELLALEKVNEVYVFGHVADGNIHLIVDKENESDDLRKAINAIVYGPLKDLGGSVSAEHGIGLDKKDYLSLCRSSAEITLMKQLKRQLDPYNLLNPGKVLDMKSESIY